MGQRTECLDAKNLNKYEDREGNNAAFQCPSCHKVFIVSGLLHPKGRQCPESGKSTGRVVEGKGSGGEAALEWQE
jgi:hypothetical protein